MSNRATQSNGSTVMRVVSRKRAISCFCSGFTSAMTSNTLSGLPATMPAATEAFSPFKPPVLGTMTLFTFLMMLPEATITTRLGMVPNTLRAFAAA